MTLDPLVILIPIFDDWLALTQLLHRLDTVLAETGQEGRVLLVDDGSTLTLDLVDDTQAFSAFTAVEVLHLKRNLGNQRAICIGLAYIEAHRPCQRILVMDGDGEDDPADVVRLLDRYSTEEGRKIVFAERSKRSESLWFRMGYQLFRLLHWILVGAGIRVGNFSVIPFSRLRSLTVTPELWSHYAAAVRASRLPYCTVPTRRAKRIDGFSSMGTINLVVHGMSAISVYSDRIGVRMLTFILPLLVLVGLTLGGLVGMRLFSDVAVPAWAGYAVALLVLVLLQIFWLIIVFCFIILKGRIGNTFLPVRDYPFFVDRLETWWTSAPDPKSPHTES
jgi:glycosyltransferase involved in cell wall biosynthesis